MFLFRDKLAPLVLSTFTKSSKSNQIPIEIRYPRKRKRKVVVISAFFFFFFQILLAGIIKRRKSRNKDLILQNEDRMDKLIW